jgi:hypothetical protein
MAAGAADPQRARDERAEPEERRVAQIHLSGVSGDDVPALGQRDEQQHEEDEVQHVVAANGERQ